MNAIEELWLSWDKKLITLLKEQISNIENDSMSLFLIRDINLMNAKNEIINQRFIFLEKEFGLTKKEVKSFASPSSSLFSCSVDELKEKIPHFIELFKSLHTFKRVMRTSAFSMYEKDLLAYEVKEIEQELSRIEIIFKTDREGAIEMMCNSSYYLDCPTEKLAKKIDKIEKLLQIDHDRFVIMAKMYPYILKRNYNKLKSNIKLFSDFFNVNESTVCKMMNKYPPFIYWNISDLRSVILGNEKENIKRKAVKMPWILNLITKIKGYENCGYCNFDDLANVCSYIENVFGEVVKCHTIEKKDSMFTYLVIAPTEERRFYTLVSVGGYFHKEQTPEERLSLALYGEYERGFDFDEMIIHVPVDKNGWDIAVDSLRYVSYLKKTSIPKKVNIGDGKKGILVYPSNFMSQADFTTPMILKRGEWKTRFISLIILFNNNENEQITGWSKEEVEKIINHISFT